MNRQIGAVVAILCLALPACTYRGAHQHPDDATQIRLKPQDVSLTGPGEGKSCVQNILGIETGQPSFLDAQQGALQVAGAEILLDEVSYEGMENAFGFVLPSIFPPFVVPVILFGNHCTYVEGFGARRLAGSPSVTTPTPTPEPPKAPTKPSAGKKQ